MDLWAYPLWKIWKEDIRKGLGVVDINKMREIVYTSLVMCKEDRWMHSLKIGKLESWPFRSVEEEDIC